MTTITASSPRITKTDPLRARAIVSTIALALSTVAARAGEAPDHLRGEILGTTLTSIDYGDPAKYDRHLEMSPAPFVTIAKRSDEKSIVKHAFVSVVTDNDGTHPRAVVIVPDTAHVFTEGRTAWDLPHTTITNGRVEHRKTTKTGFTLTIAYGKKTATIFVPQRTPVIALSPSSRDALLSPRRAFIFADPPGGELTDRLHSIIVSEGGTPLPF